MVAEFLAQAIAALGGFFRLCPCLVDAEAFEFGEDGGGGVVVEVGVGGEVGGGHGLLGGV